jgi:hypothetical protein
VIVGTGVKLLLREREVFSGVAVVEVVVILMAVVVEGAGAWSSLSKITVVHPDPTITGALDTSWWDLDGRRDGRAFRRR